jgi:hypothetical protein
MLLVAPVTGHCPLTISIDRRDSHQHGERDGVPDADYLGSVASGRQASLNSRSGGGATEHGPGCGDGYLVGAATRAGLEWSGLRWRHLAWGLVV